MRRATFNRGVSLIEIMVSMTVLGLAMTLMIALIPATATNLSLAEVRTQAGALAQSELETLASKSLSGVTSGPRPPVALEDGTELTPTVNLTTEAQGTTRVRVTVKWKTRGIEREQFREKVVFPLPR